MRTARPLLLGSLLVLSCARPQPIVRPGEISFREFEVRCPRASVFDSALAFAHALNLSVAVLEKQSGLIQLERARLTEPHLDAFCVFPFLDGETKEPLSSFTSWGIEQGEVVNGSVQISILLSEAGPDRTKVNMRGRWSAVLSDYAYRGYEQGAEQVYELQSVGGLEAMLAGHLEAACAGRPLRIRETGARIEKLVADLVLLQSAYANSEITWESYQQRRDGILSALRSVAMSPPS
jgi:hypothetical protein